jgi:hypothetical protein
VNRQIVGYHQDEEQHWIAELECGHSQHVRHDPPWQIRAWVTTHEGRRSRLGSTLECRRCDEKNLTRAHGHRSGGGLLRLPNQLDLDGDLDFIADEDPTRFECLVPGKTEVRAIDLPVGTKSSPLCTPGIGQTAPSRDI